MKFLKRAATVSAFLLASAVSVASASEVPNFSFKDVDGRYHRFSEYRGKWVVVNYWATYCGPCVAELPTLNSVARHYKDKLVVLGMEAGETPADELKQFAEERRLSFPVIPTQDSTMFAMGLIYGVPTTFIVSPEGKIIDTHMGAITAAQVQKYLRQDKHSSVAEDKGKKENCPSGFC